MKLLSFAGTAALAAVLAAPASAGIVNLGFASGNLNGWSVAGTGTVSAVQDALDASQNSYARTEPGRVGESFAQLIAGPDDLFTTLSRQFTVSGSGSLSFEAAFLAFDTSDFNDDGFVRVTNDDDPSQVFNLFHLSNADVGDNASSGWTPFTQTLAAGHYTITAGVENVGDDLANFSSDFDGQLLLDNVSLSDTGGAIGGVPEPASWALMIAGFGLVGGALRRRRSSLLQGA
jgi:hypothetical protein